jgi:hypothetical protein
MREGHELWFRFLNCLYMEMRCEKICELYENYAKKLMLGKDFLFHLFVIRKRFSTDFFPFLQLQRTADSKKSKTHYS